MSATKAARAKIRVRCPDEFERWRRLIDKARQRREKGAVPGAVPKDEQLSLDQL